jgi:peptidoglycan/LPS O-acetylase OafA/YrhL
MDHRTSGLHSAILLCGGSFGLSNSSVVPDAMIGEAQGQGGLPHAMQVHISPLDGLRGWAAMMVVFAHIGFFGTQPLAYPEIGNYGVFLFFVLSGFLMGHLYLTKPFDRRAVENYFAARISRIVPLYYVTVVAGFLIGQFIDPKFTYAMSVKMLVRHLLFTGNVSAFWSIGPEFQFYFIFPVLWWVVKLPTHKAMVWGVPLFLLTLIIFLYRYDMPGVIVFSKMHIFLVGILLAYLRRWLLNRVDTHVAMIAQVGAILFLTALFLPRQWLGEAIYPSTYGDMKLNRYYQDFGKLLILAFVVISFTFETKFANTIFANAVAKLIGKYSFSIYLLHIPVLYVLQRSGLYDHTPYVLSLVVTFGAIITVCAVSFFVLEEPSRVLTRKALLRIFASKFSHRKVGPTVAKDRSNVP